MVPDRKGDNAVLNLAQTGQRRRRIRDTGIGRRLQDKLGLISATLTLALAYGLAPSQSFALSFYPSESEWLTWPDYCRARYVVSGAGSTSNYANRVSPDEVAYHRKRMGEGAWEYLHHYCAGIVHFVPE